MQDINIKYPLKFHPVLKCTIWGGDKIVPFKGLLGSVSADGVQYSQMERVGEFWAVSTVPGYESVVSNGALDGTSLVDIVSKYKGALLGEKNYRRFSDNFPLLVKFIDAARDLSVQVHPDDAMAQEHHNCSGKTEMWYVIDSQNEATLLTGFGKEMTYEEFCKLSGSEIIETLQKCKIKSGDMFYLPAGTIHSIGAGAFIAEIQQSSDITYRIYDYDRRDRDGNLRELHTELAAKAIDFSRTGSSCKVTYQESNAESNNVWDYAFNAVDGEHFSTSVVKLSGRGKFNKYVMDYSALDSFVILTCVDGASVLEYDGGTMTFSKGDVILLPALLKSLNFLIEENTSCRFLETHI